jgi:FkbM family methyltransferase
MLFESKISNFMLTKKYAKNWASVVFRILSRKEVIVSLRSGVIISGVKDPIALMKLLSRGWKIEEHDQTSIVLKNRDSVKLKCRLQVGSDLGHLVEIFETDTYLQNLQNSIVIDIGASTADSSILFATRGAKEVYGVEPMKESFDLAMFNVRENNLEGKVYLINAALTDKTGSVELIVSSQNPNANSINPTDKVKKTGIKFDSKRVIDSISLKDIISQYSLSKINLLKMDCEGCEYEVLKNIEEETLSLIDSIILEYHDGVKFLADFLEKKGYNVSYDRPTGLGILRAIRDTINVNQSVLHISNDAV